MHSYSNLIVKGVNSIHWKKDSLLNTQWWENLISTYRRIKLDLDLSSITKINLKYIKGLIIIPETIEENKQNTIGKDLHTGL